MYLGRRKAVQLELRILCVQRAKQVLIPLDIEVRVKAALHQHARAAEFDRLIDTLLDLFHRMDVGVGFSRPSVEGAEGADDVADIRIVDIAVDDVRYDLITVLALADLVGREADTQNVLRFEKRGAIVGRKAFAREGFVQDWLY